ncbi:MAG: deoxyribose-phosphate aldolase [Halolamina sp.]
MEYAEFAAAIDHTVLGPETTLADVTALLEEADDYGLNACIPPCYVAEAAAEAPAVTLATVIGFPHGHHRPAVLAAEAEAAVADGADELDVVAPVGRVKAAGDPETATTEADAAAAVRDAVDAVVDATSVPVKVIVETPVLTDAEKHLSCAAAADAGADMVKTATGFADGGATVPDVELMSEYLPVKASGGVGSYEAARAMLEAGAERIGASSGVAIARGHPDAPE